jgi:hypothetical protein
MIFVLGDADKIRERVEAALFEGDLADLSAFSKSLTAAIGLIVDRMQQELSATVIMAGGDDVLFTLPSTSFDASKLGSISERFRMDTGCTMSFGVGVSIEDAYLCLRKAKALGGGTVKMGADV